MCKPEFKKPLQNLTVKDGEELLLQCIVEGDPEPQIMWSKNGNKISSSEIIDLKYKNGVASLRINEVYPEDEGDYVCKATNSVGSNETKCKLSIQRKYLSWILICHLHNFEFFLWKIVFVEVTKC